MAEHVMEDVRLLEIVEFELGPDKSAGRKSPIGEVLEEGVVRNEAGNRHHAPARHRRKSVAKLREVGNARLRQLEPLHRL